MALLIVAGLPCSGRSTRVAETQAYFETHLAEVPSLARVTVVTDEDVHVDKSVYEGASFVLPSAKNRGTCACGVPECGAARAFAQHDRHCGRGRGYEY